MAAQWFHRKDTEDPVDVDLYADLATVSSDIDDMALVAAMSASRCPEAAGPTFSEAYAAVG